MFKMNSSAHLHRVICDSFISGRPECIAVAFLVADEFRADHAVLIAVQKDKRAARPGRRLNIGIVL